MFTYFGLLIMGSLLTRGIPDLSRNSKGLRSCSGPDEAARTGGNLGSDSDSLPLELNHKWDGGPGGPR